MDQNLFERVDRYIARRLAPEDGALQTVTRSLETEGIPDAGVSANQGKLLQFLAVACNAKRILELGTLGGYSTVWMARALPADGKLISIEFDEAHAALARRNMEHAGLAQKVQIQTGKALDVLPRIEAEMDAPFDMVFIDADKPPYTEYFQWALKLTRPGSIIVADNVVRNGKILDENTSDEKVRGVQRFNDRLAGCTEVTAIILQTVGVKEYDGIALAVVNRRD